MEILTSKRGWPRAVWAQQKEQGMLSGESYVHAKADIRWRSGVGEKVATGRL
jgi:hypothetical protein